MPEHLRALVVILVIAVAVFVIGKWPVTAVACTKEDYARRRNLWFLLTLSAFLAHNFWLFAVAASCILYYGAKKETNPFAMYLTLFLALPEVSANIPGFGIIDSLFRVEPLRLLSLFVLLPCYLALRKQPGTDRFGQLPCDKLLFAYLAIGVLLTLPYRTVTAVLRDGVFYAFTDVFLPYYVASRSLRSVKSFRDALASLMVPAMVFSLIVFLEFWRYWLLYTSLDNALGVDLGGNPYLTRSGQLRGVGTAGQSIVTGYTCAFAFGLYLYVRTLVTNTFMRHLGLLVLVMGLIGALSRAPWVGAGMMVVLFILLGPKPVAGVAKMALAGLLVVPILLTTKTGASIIDHLPWIGTVDARNVDGRAHLADVAFDVFLEAPIFGRFDIVAHPSIEGLRGSDGIIDMVNTYIYIGLTGGGVTLALFGGFFALALFGIFRNMRRIGDGRDERHVLGRALFATLVGVLFIIGTVSPIFFITPIYWCLGGLAVGYARLVEQGEPQAQARAEPTPWTGPGVPSGYGRPAAGGRWQAGPGARPGAASRHGATRFR